MKNYAIVLATIFMLFFTSCESWLDIQQEGEVTVAQLYSTGEGYRTALNGVYQAMGRPALYLNNTIWQTNRFQLIYISRHPSSSTMMSVWLISLIIYGLQDLR